MKRRLFFKNAASASLGLGLTKYTPSETTNNSSEKDIQFCVTVEENKLHFFSDVIKEPIKIVHIADTHLFRDDERGVPYRKYSGRMAKAYNETRHFKTDELTNPELAFEAALNFAKESQADLITLIGDIFSFPSEAAIEWVQALLKEVDIPYIYVAGNHDWHYEGMEGPLEDLRDTWINKRLLSLYQGNHPLMAAYDVKGIRFLAIDNSTYQINDDQLPFFKNMLPAMFRWYFWCIYPCTPQVNPLVLDAVIRIGELLPIEILSWKDDLGGQNRDIPRRPLIFIRQCFLHQISWVYFQDIFIDFHWNRLRENLK